jgi:hypothetical protein
MSSVIRRIYVSFDCCIVIDRSTVVVALGQGDVYVVHGGIITRTDARSPLLWLCVASYLFPLPGRDTRICTDVGAYSAYSSVFRGVFRSFHFAMIVFRQRLPSVMALHC